MNHLLAFFHFLRPWWLLLALLWGPLLWWWARDVRRGHGLHKLVDARLLPHLLRHGGRVGRAVWWLPLLSAVLVTLSLAGPAWTRLAQPLYSSGAAQVVLVSLSQRMLATDVKPDRMQRVRYKVHDLLHANPDGSNALVAYAGETFVVAPLSADAHALDELVNAMDPDVMPVHGDAPAKAISQGVRLLEQAGERHGSLVLVTDKVDKAALAAAGKARASGMHVSVLGVGASTAAPVRLDNGRLLTDAGGDVVMSGRDDASLKALAAAGGGIYVPMDSGRADIRALKTELDASRQASTATHRQVAQWRDMGPWLLLPLLGLAALACRRGWLLLLPLVLLPYGPLRAQTSGASPAVAGSVATPPGVANSTAWRERWRALWLNGDQRAADALEEGHAGQARRSARTPAMRGAAAYKAGDYAAAASDFAMAGTADATYNRGNALARQGHYRQAIEAYDKALKMDPGHADAEANRQAVKQWLHRQKQASDDSSGGASTSRDREHGKAQDDASAGRQGKKPESSAAKDHATSEKEDHAGQTRDSSASGRNPDAGKQAPAPATAGSRMAPPRPSEGKADKGKGENPSAAGTSADNAVPAGHSGRAGDFDLGRAPAHAGSTLPAPMEKALDRVRDDPGGLLRRKFELEYRQRQNGSKGGAE